MTLFRPRGRGMLNHLVTHNIWRAYRRVARRRPGLLEYAGPLVLIAVLGTWAALIAVGSALIYWPHLPSGFVLAQGLDPATHDDFLDAFYLSIVTLVTLGFGDIVPTGNWLRIMAGVEAEIGFVLLTAGISWVLSIYPVLRRQRALARQVTMLEESQKDLDLSLDSLGSNAASTLSGLAEQIVMVSGDVAQFPVTYYFYEREPNAALPAVLPCLLRYSEERSDDEPNSLRLQRRVLRRALEDYASSLRALVLSQGPPDVHSVFDLYARDHFHDAASVQMNERRE